MKKIFTLLALAICSLSAMATDYTGTLNATLIEQGLSLIPPTPGMVTFNQDNNGTTYSITIPATDLGVGILPEITIPNITGTTVDGKTTLDGATVIVDLSGFLGEGAEAIPVTLDPGATADMTELSLSANVPIGVLGTVNVTFTGTVPAPTVVNTNDYPGLLTANVGGKDMPFPDMTVTVNEMSDGTYQLVVPGFSPVPGVQVPAITIPGVKGTKDGDNITFDGITTSVDLGSLGTTNVTLNSAAVTDGDLTLDATVVVEGLIPVGVTFGPATTDGVHSVTTTSGKPVAMYNMNGQQVDINTNAKGVYVIKYSDGKTVKVVK